MQHYAAINNNNNNRDGVTLAGYPGEGQNGGMRKTPVMGKGLWSLEDDK